MASNAPSLFGTSATATLAIDSTSGQVVVASSKADDFIGAMIAPIVAPFNGGASASVGMGHTVGALGLAAAAMLIENKFSIVNKVLPAGDSE